MGQVLMEGTSDFMQETQVNGSLFLLPGAGLGQVPGKILRVTR